MNNKIMSFIVSNRNGMMILFTALLMPAFMFFAVLMIDGGNVYIARNQLRHITQSSANSGLIELSTLLIKKAYENKNLLCDPIKGENQLAECESDNIFDFLNENDIFTIIESPTNINYISQKVQEFVENFSISNSENIASNDIQIIYPYPKFEFGENSVSIKVQISKKIFRFFNKFLINQDINSSEVIVKAISKLPLE